MLMIKILVKSGEKNGETQNPTPVIIPAQWKIIFFLLLIKHCYCTWCTAELNNLLSSGFLLFFSLGVGR